MNTLEKISAEVIRKNWNNYKNELTDTTCNIKYYWMV